MNVSGSGDESSGERLPFDGVTVTASDAHPLVAGRRIRTFESLVDVPAFRWYMLSQVGNQSAQLMQMVVRGFLAYEITGSFAALGFVELANSIPRVFLALYGGTMADRASRRVIIQVGQGLNALIATTMAVLLFSGSLRFEHFLIGAVCQGILNSFVMPARQSMIPEIVGPQRLMNGFALNTFGMNVLRLGAPAIAGGLIAAFGGGWVFALMVILFLFALFTLFRVPKTTAITRAAALGSVSPRMARPPSRTGGREIKEALVYLGGQRILCMLLVLQCAISILSLPYQRLMPGFVDEVLSGGDSDRTAALMVALISFTAIGALVGSLLIASLPSRRRGKLLVASLVIFAVGMLAFSISESFWLSSAIVVVLGVGQAG